MKWLNRKLSRQGFTLIELIVVIAILGILILIAVPRLGAFRERALATTNEANLRIMQGAGAMWLAENGNPAATTQWTTSSNTDQWGKYLEKWPSGINSFTINTDGSFAWDAPGVTGSGSGGTTPPPAAPVVATRVGAPVIAATGNSVSVTSTAGELLVLITGHRSDQGPAPTIATWTLHGTQTQTGDRSQIAVYSKISTGGTQTVTANWPGVNTQYQYIMVQRFAGATDYNFEGFVGQSNATAATSLTLTRAAGPNSLVVAGFVGRGNRGTVAFSNSNLEGVQSAYNATSDLTHATGYTSTADGSIAGTTVSFSSGHASATLVVFSLSD